MAYNGLGITIGRGGPYDQTTEENIANHSYKSLEDSFADITTANYFPPFLGTGPGRVITTDVLLVVDSSLQIMTYQLIVNDDTGFITLVAPGTANGDVTGPNVSIPNSVGVFADNTGKTLADSSVTITGGNTLTSPNVTVSSLGTGIVHTDSGGVLSSSTIVNDDVSPTAAIVDTKLATIATAGKVANTATTATSANTPSTIVARDGSGNIAVTSVTSSSSTISGLTTGVVHSNGSGLLSSSTVVNADVDAAAGIVDTKLATIATAGKVSNSATTATSANTASTIVARDSSGNIAVNQVALATDGVNPLDAVTVQQLNAVSAGISIKEAARVATTGNLTATYANGAAGVGATLTNSGTQVAIAIDGVTLSVNDRILVLAQSAPAQNGIYKVTNTGSGATNWIITRTTDYDAASEITQGSLVAVNEGTVNGNTSWLQTASVVTVGTDPILFSQFTASPASFLKVSNNLSDLNNAATARTNLHLTDSTAAIDIDTLTVGALSTGIAHLDASGVMSSSLIVNADVDAAAAIVDTKLATISTASKVSNSATTATDVNTASAIVARDGSGNFSAGTITASVTGASSLNVLKAGDTMTGALTINPTTNQVVLGGVAGGNTTTITSTAPASNKTYTIPDAGANTQFVMGAGSQTVAGTKTFSTAPVLSSLSTGILHSDSGGNLTSSAIINADVDAAAAIVDTKLATISTALKVSNSATTATSANTASAIVARDGSGNFSAGTITATVTGASSLNVLKAGDTMTGALTINPTTNQLVLGGVSAGTTTTITSTAPSTNKTYTIPDAGTNTQFVMGAGTQTVAGAKTFSTAPILSSLSTGILHSDSGGNLTSSTIVNADVNAAAAIVDTKLATISTALKVSNSATTAASANTASAIVARDGSGNFSAGTITASVTGASSLNVLKAGDTMTGALTINPTTNQLVLGGVAAGTTTTITSTAPASSRTYTIPDAGGAASFVMTEGTQTINGNKTISGTTNLSGLTASKAVVTDGSKNLTSLTYTDANTASAIVSRDGSGNFSAGTITGVTKLLTPALDTASAGTLTIGGTTATGITFSQDMSVTGGKTILWAGAGAVTKITASTVFAASLDTLVASSMSIGGANATDLAVTPLAKFSNAIQTTTVDALTATTLTIGPSNATAVSVTPVLTAAGKLNVGGTTNQLVFNGTANSTTITAPNPAAGRTYTIPDAGAAASFVMTEGAQTLNATKTFSAAIPITATTNQLVLGTTNTTTITSPAPSASRTYTIPDFGGAASVVLTSNTTTTIKSGTYSPTIGDGTNNFTGISAGGWYQIVGDLVTFGGFVSWTGKGSASAGAGLVVSIPFTANQNPCPVTLIYTSGLTYTGTWLSGSIPATASFIIYSNASATTASQLAVSAASTAGQINFGGSFRTA